MKQSDLFCLKFINYRRERMQINARLHTEVGVDVLTHHSRARTSVRQELHYLIKKNASLLQCVKA